MTGEGSPTGEARVTLIDMISEDGAGRAATREGDVHFTPEGIFFILAPSDMATVIVGVVGVFALLALWVVIGIAVFGQPAALCLFPLAAIAWVVLWMRRANTRREAWRLAAATTPMTELVRENPGSWHVGVEEIESVRRETGNAPRADSLTIRLRDGSVKVLPHPDADGHAASWRFALDHGWPVA